MPVSRENGGPGYPFPTPDPVHGWPFSQGRVCRYEDYLYGRPLSLPFSSFMQKPTEKSLKDMGISWGTSLLLTWASLYCSRAYFIANSTSMQTLTLSINSTCPVLGHILSTHVKFGTPTLQKKDLFWRMCEFAWNVCCKNWHMDYEVFVPSPPPQLSLLAVRILRVIQVTIAVVKGWEQGYYESMLTHLNIPSFLWHSNLFLFFCTLC